MTEILAVLGTRIPPDEVLPDLVSILRRPVRAGHGDEGWRTMARSLPANTASVGLAVPGLPGSGMWWIELLVAGARGRRCLTATRSTRRRSARCCPDQRGRSASDGTPRAPHHGGGCTGSRCRARRSFAAAPSARGRRARSGAGRRGRAGGGQARARRRAAAVTAESQAVESSLTGEPPRSPSTPRRPRRRRAARRSGDHGLHRARGRQGRARAVVVATGCLPKWAASASCRGVPRSRYRWSDDLTRSAGGWRGPRWRRRPRVG